MSEDSTCANFAQVADNGKTYQYKFYSLSDIIAVGYRVNSGRATQFRQWATKVLDTFAKQGYVLDKGKGAEQVATHADTIEHAVRDYVTAPAGYAIDFGVTDDGRTLLVEVNDGYALGSYGLFYPEYAKLLSARWAELTSTEDVCDFTGERFDFFASKDQSVV